jgi:elongation factor Ts
MATTDEVKKLRDMTGISVMQCKAALEEAGGDVEKAIAILKGKGSAIAAKKADRALGAGAVSAYVHANSVGAMVTLQSETDFVAKNAEFIALARAIAMQVAAIGADDVAALLAQPYIKDESKSVRDLIEAAVQKFGERIEVGEIARFSVK